MWDQQPLRSACAYAQSDQSLCKSLEYSIIVKLLTEHHLEFLSFCQNVKLLEISCHGSCIIIELTVWQENFAHFMFVNSLQPVTNNFCFSMGSGYFQVNDLYTRKLVALLSCQPRVTVTSCFVKKVIRDL